MRLPAVLLLLAAVVAAIATADHTWKTHRADRAELREWYCEHKGTRCGGPSSGAIERHWNERELGYEIAAAGSVAAATAVGLRRLGRRRRRT